MRYVKLSPKVAQGDMTRKVAACSIKPKQLMLI